MKAAVVTRYDAPPGYGEVPEPETAHADEVVVEVLAAGLHPRVRAQAAGSHYTSTGSLPLVPGIDGVGRTADGQVRYFILEDTDLGSMAERTVVDLRRSVLLPAGADPAVVAAAMNPAMSSWIALRRRAGLRPGRHVVVLGATGNAGRLAVSVARLLGAGRVTAVGRGAARLQGLGADDVVTLDGDQAEVSAALGAAASRADVVLDYLWGPVTADALRAIVPARADDEQPLSWVQIGSVAGPESPIPSAALRATRLQIVGSGQGSVPTRDIVAELAELALAVSDGRLAVPVRRVPLRDVEAAWVEPGDGGLRTVVVP
jgi:NADPH:quinone reductase-like Zn-dependent oxidoreductase